MRDLAERPGLFAELEEAWEERWLHRAGEDPDDTPDESVSWVLPADAGDLVVPEEDSADVPF